MAARLCWHCENRSHVELVTHYVIEESDRYFGQDPYEYVVGFFRCDECRFPSLGLTERKLDGRGSASTEAWLDGEGSPYEEPPTIDWLPEQNQGRKFPDVPVTIAETADEAYRCHSFGAYRATAALARAVVEATAKEQGIAKGLLNKKIEELEERRIVRPSIRRTLDHVRFLGNDVAHGDLVDPPTEEESALALEFIAQLLEEVYGMPARLERAEAARGARLAGPAWDLSATPTVP